MFPKSSMILSSIRKIVFSIIETIIVGIKAAVEVVMLSLLWACLSHVCELPLKISCK